MIERSKALDEVDLYEETFAEDSGFSRIKKGKGSDNNRSMPVGSHTKAKSGRRRFGKQHSYAANGPHRRYRRKSLQTPKHDG